MAFFEESVKLCRRETGTAHAPYSGQARRVVYTLVTIIRALHSEQRHVAEASVAGGVMLIVEKRENRI